jgi:protein gp37
MGEHTEISWCDHTFNPFIGCTQLSAACDFCYAKTLAERYGWVDWNGPPKRTSDANWRKPIAWDRKAAAAGVRRRVFCASLADVFDNQAPEQWRADLWALIAATPHLDWLLLTKRPQNILGMLPIMWGDGWPNVWLGCTTENQDEFNRRWPRLNAVPARVHFVSYEPALGPLALPQGAAPDWVVAGGESGSHARPAHPDWFRALRDQCRSRGIAYHFKQHGEFAPEGLATERWIMRADGSADAMSTPQGIGYHPPRDGSVFVYRVGKKRAGRLLDGVEHNEFPA